MKARKIKDKFNSLIEKKSENYFLFLSGPWSFFFAEKSGNFTLKVENLEFKLRISVGHSHFEKKLNRKIFHRKKNESLPNSVYRFYFSFFKIENDLSFYIFQNGLSF